MRKDVFILIRFPVYRKDAETVCTHTHTDTHTLLIVANSSSGQARQGKEPAWVGFFSLQRGPSVTH